MTQPFDASRSLTSLEQDSTMIAVIEMSQAKWVVAAVVPGVERQPFKRLDAATWATMRVFPSSLYLNDHDGSMPTSAWVFS